ncbi:MAG: hypothetical protein F3740_05920 [Nitrospinae bacterium]|nr:hypothetical protein [Nitrospinota bacterium]
MEKIEDSGKVWIKGSSSPTHAVRVGNKIFATGKSEEQAIECWLDQNMLCVDLNNSREEIRIAKKFPLNTEPGLSGTLFNGFTQTKHADVLIVSSDSEQVEEKMVSGDFYKEGKYNSMGSREFWNKIWS